MRISQLTQILSKSPEATIRFRLPNGELTPAHAHVTEVAHITKRFIDCGGTFRDESVCRLQTWVADDYQHRLNAGKLVKIIAKARPLLGDQDLEVEVEHDLGFVTQLPLEDIESIGSETVLILKGKNTTCLAPELCCPPPSATPLVGLGKKSAS